MTISVSVLFLTVVAVVVSADSQCLIQSADAVLILDGSGSVGSAGWTKSLTFMTGLMEGFDVGFDKVRVGMISFSKESKVAFKLNMYSKQSDVIKAIRVQKYPGITTYTHRALQQARDTLFQTRNGMRQSTPNIVFLITDGQSQDPDKTKKAAQKLHAENVTIFVIGVGDRVGEQELNDISSNVSFVYKITDFSSLATEQTKLQQKLCNEFAALYPNTSKTTTTMQAKTTTAATSTPTTMTATTTTTSTARTTTSQFPVRGDCYDIEPRCGNSERLLCNDMPLLRFWCAKTCGFCKPLDKVKADQNLTVTQAETTPMTTPPKSMLLTSTRSMTTTRAPCQDRNMTFYVKSGEERALVEITANILTEMAVGRHVVHRFGCKMNIEVINNSTAGLNYTCPGVIRDIVSLATELADIQLTVAGIRHRMKLPVGYYEYQIGGGDNPCNITVIIQDHRLIRRLDVVANYGIKCSLLTDNIVLSTLRTLANSNVNQIREICQQDCGPQTGSEAVLSCENDTLTVIWPTDVTYNGAVTEIPVGLKKRLTDRLAEQSRYPILNLLVLTNMPPLVYPTKTNTGAYAELMLTSSCLQNMNYDQTTDSCI